MQIPFLLCLAAIVFYTPLSSAEFSVDPLPPSMDEIKKLNDTPLTFKPLHSVRIEDQMYHQNSVNLEEEYNTTPEPAAPRPGDVVGLSKQIYSSLASGDAAEIAERFRPAFDGLNHDNKLGDTLSILYDMRLMDLQASVKHARKMKEVITILSQ
jgi:hypothetical protein